MTQAPSALFLRHRPLAHSIAGAYYLPGGDDDDVRQEALIALWVAARGFDREFGVPFSTFARLVIHRRLGTAVRFATRGKHRMLTESVREVELEDGPAPAVELLVEPHGDQVEQLMQRDEVRRIVEVIGGMTDLERTAIVGHVFEGRSYQALVDEGPFRDYTQVDNALQRAREKLREAA